MTTDLGRVRGVVRNGVLEVRGIPYAASPATKWPVIGWIHGGGFVGGAGSLYWLDRLAREAGAVVVSINYRLGVFGFMPPPDFAVMAFAPGYGTRTLPRNGLDSLAAGQFVRQPWIRSPRTSGPTSASITASMSGRQGCCHGTCRST